MHLRESRTSKFSGLRQIYPPVTLKYPLVQKLIETPAFLDQSGTKTILFGVAHTYIAYIREYTTGLSYTKLFRNHTLK